MVAVDQAGFRTLSRSVGYLSQDFLWGVASEQVAKGRMAPPLPFDADGGMPGICENTVNTTFGFAVVQMGETRAPDDFQYGRVNAFCGARAVKKLPTWGHIGQM